VSAKFRWYFVSIVQQEGQTVRIIRLDIDAVFAESGPNALEIAATRNPLRPGEEFATNRATLLQRTKAIRLHDRRIEEIAQLAEILETRCGMGTGS
jgi:hypothetical protein